MPKYRDTQINEPAAYYGSFVWKFFSLLFMYKKAPLHITATYCQSQVVFIKRCPLYIQYEKV